MDTEKRLIWTVHPDGVHVHREGRLVGVIPICEGMHLIQDLAPHMRDYFEVLRRKQKTPQPD